MRRAFSLLEVVVVIAVLAIAAAVSMPARSAAGADYRARLASQRIAADMRLLQRDTWYNASQARIVFDVAGDSYSLENLGNKGSTRSVSLAVDPYRADLQSVSFGGAIELTYRGGEPSVSGDGVVRLETAGTVFQTTIESGQETELKSVDRAASVLD